MTRIWIIRVVLLVALAICAAGWGYSITHTSAIFYRHNNSHFGVRSTGGSFSASFSEFDGGDRWNFDFRPISASVLQPTNMHGPQYSLLGFEIGQLNGVAWKWCGAAVPYWFVMLLLGMAFIFTWWKRKGAAKGAFPVDVAKESK